MKAAKIYDIYTPNGKADRSTSSAFPLRLCDFAGEEVSRKAAKDAKKDKHFFIKQHGRWAATPLFIAPLFLEMTDIIFAVDSVPAIFAVPKEPLIVFTSNIFAILGLRSLYFMLAGAADKFHLLKYGLC